MSATYGDRVQEVFTTTGTGTISLGGAVTGYQAFSAVVANAGTAYYMATDGTNWEVGLGTYATSGNTLARTTILSSSTGSAINWAAGSKTISLVLPASVISTFSANPAPKAHITGFVPGGLTTNTNIAAALGISAGQATDSTGAALLSGSSFSWGVANGNAADGYQGGTTLPNSSTIHFFAIAKPTDLTWTHSFASTSLAPTLPSGYTLYRRVFSMTTNSSGALNYVSNNCVEADGGAVELYFDSAKLDIAVTNQGTGGTLYTLSVPQGLNMRPLYRTTTPTNNSSIILLSQIETSQSTSAFSNTAFTAAPGATMMNSTSTTNVSPIVNDGNLITDTSGRIAVNANATSTALYFVTRGYRDFRRV